MKGINHKISGLVLIAALLCTATSAEEGAGVGEKELLRISTTTSLYDTLLLDEIEDIFEDMYNVDVRTVSGGTGIAIERAVRGEADLILVHDVVRERKFIDDGYGISRTCFAYNYFIIVGPQDDPAGIVGMEPSEAMRTIMAQGMENPDQVKFVSRGDDSGTHAREKILWDRAGIDYAEVTTSNLWYREAGQGMGPTLRMTSEMEAYTLCDTSTFAAYRSDLDLVPLIEEGDVLLNVYAAIPVSPAVHPAVNCEMAAKFVDLLVSEEGQDLIAEYGTDTIGRPLFKAARGNCDLIGCDGDECVTPLPEDLCILVAA
ncbi:substrate-binding domain-containing protein [Methanotrichaceae archaeon M04Ac]|jgi:tungstate transport system substrate-binding protein|uniref:Substrate-binding domain-containing protein n=1 Tax=Candidatus Methanocrinis alkalitolerans TaxID=3033395 RepID=A0ABT5XDL4_9EURY|nr:substrate-binding domain-containing protein [Candidatus Methanocrinis alkalitolerans]MDF0592792.1 substrate-binding domain-containing protein [Candidatus Methanocrinis alkalitolerans]